MLIRTYCFKNIWSNINNLFYCARTTHAAFFDYDQDGDLDVYILNNSFIPVTTLGYNDKRDLRDSNWDVPLHLKASMRPTLNSPM